MRIKLFIAMVVIVIAAAFVGCGKKTAQAPVANSQQPIASSQKPLATSSQATPSAKQLPLPEWAPKNPSREFLRAAKVLKPLPAEMWQQMPEPSPARQAMLDRIVRTYPAAWEFFGSLTDKQVQAFLTSKSASEGVSKEILIPVKSLTRNQRAALDRYFETFRQAMKGTTMAEEPAWMEDRVVTFYHFGAKEDLSNVDAGFNAIGHSVNITFRIRKPDKDMRGFGTTIATL